MKDALPRSAKVAVIGAGTMGTGIAQVAASAGHAVYLHDAFPGACERGKKAIEKDLAALVSRGKLAADEAAAIAARVHPIHKLHAAADSALVIEAIVEDEEAKRTLYGALEAEVASGCIIATNTSSLSITALARGMKHPERLVGMHFFNPAPRMALVEVVSGLFTSPEVAAQVAATANAWGKTSVQVKSTPGFIVNRVARPFYGEALRLLAEQAADPATLDALLRDSAMFRMGPCELMDMIGLDVNLAVTTSLFQAMGYDRRYAPSLLQQELVRAGRLGRKSGEGFYRYVDGEAGPTAAVEPTAEAAESITLTGELAPLQALAARLKNAGIGVKQVARSDPVEPGVARVALSDGRSATRRAVEEHGQDFVLLDLCLDYAKAVRIGVTRAAQCRDEPYRAVVGALQKAGFAVTPVADVAGLVVLRTVAMLANEAADVVAQGIGSAADVDTAMRLGTNYPQGPLAWADQLGPALVARVLANLQAHYGEDRYRISPALNRLRWSGGKFHA
ncbi:MAG TPA: 3-hydroxyacyl-CoA dehydrogenase PaaH [Burkholderiales bacterium]|nr:3-hydroxyacyl-CoA dehydrogenase PaaH [Burkholderiales bacterium]